MSYQDQKRYLSAMHVAKNCDVAREGGYLEVRECTLVHWPQLHMHIKIGDLDGAVWTNKQRSTYILVVTDHQTAKLERVAEMNALELSAFTAKEGIFCKLA